MAFVGDSIMENVFYSLLCDCLRTASSTALAARLVSLIERRTLHKHVVIRANGHRFNTLQATLPLKSGP